MNKVIRHECFLRSQDACEQCGRFITEGECRADHFYGRARMAVVQLEACTSALVSCVGASR